VVVMSYLGFKARPTEHQRKRMTWCNNDGKLVEDKRKSEDKAKTMGQRWGNKESAAKRYRKSFGCSVTKLIR